jgi:hypothetical protein
VIRIPLNRQKKALNQGYPISGKDQSIRKTVIVCDAVVTNFIGIWEGNSSNALNVAEGISYSETYPGTNFK